MRRRQGGETRRKLIFSIKYVVENYSMSFSRIHRTEIETSLTFFCAVYVMCYFFLTINYENSTGAMEQNSAAPAKGVNMSWIRFSFTGVPLIFWSFLTDTTEVVECPSLSLALRDWAFSHSFFSARRGWCEISQFLRCHLLLSQSALTIRLLHEKKTIDSQSSIWHVKYCLFFFSVFKSKTVFWINFW